MANKDRVINIFNMLRQKQVGYSTLGRQLKRFKITGKIFIVSIVIRDHMLNIISIVNIVKRFN